MPRNSTVAAAMDPEERERLLEAIGSVLDAYSVGDVNRGEAVEELSKLVTARQGEQRGRRRSQVEAGARGWPGGASCDIAAHPAAAGKPQGSLI